MKLIGLTLMIVFELVLGEAPYPPRGYRPPGRQFELPKNPPQREYGSSQFAPPTLEPIDFRGGQKTYFLQENQRNQFDQQDNFHQQRGFGSNRLPNQEYGAPDDTVTIQSDGSGRNRQYGAPDPTPPPTRPRGFIGTNSQNRHQRQRVQHQTPTTDIELTKSNDDEDVVGVGSQNYLPPTGRPRTEKPIEAQDSDVGDPSVAISNAVARRQYYLLQPSEPFQRITTDDLKSGGLSSKIVVQNVAPITAPLYNYNSPLIRLI